jgi:hypothetical protein
VLRDGYEAAEYERAELEHEAAKLKDALDEATNSITALRRSSLTLRHSAALSSASLSDEVGSSGGASASAAVLKDLAEEREKREAAEREAKQVRAQMDELQKQIQDVVASNQVRGVESVIVCTVSMPPMQELFCSRTCSLTTHLAFAPVAHALTHDFTRCFFFSFFLKFFCLWQSTLAPSSHVCSYAHAPLLLLVAPAGCSACHVGSRVCPRDRAYSRGRDRRRA